MIKVVLSGESIADPRSQFLKLLTCWVFQAAQVRSVYLSVPVELSKERVHQVVIQLWGQSFGELLGQPFTLLVVVVAVFLKCHKAARPPLGVEDGCDPPPLLFLG